MSLTPSFLCKGPLFHLKVVDRASGSPNFQELIQSERCSDCFDASRLLTARFRCKLTARFRCKLTARFRCKSPLESFIRMDSQKEPMIRSGGSAWRKISEADLEQPRAARFRERQPIFIPLRNRGGVW